MKNISKFIFVFMFYFCQMLSQIVFFDDHGDKKVKLYFSESDDVTVYGLLPSAEESVIKSINVFNAETKKYVEKTILPYNFKIENNILYYYEQYIYVGKTIKQKRKIHVSKLERKINVLPVNILTECYKYISQSHNYPNIEDKIISVLPEDTKNTLLQSVDDSANKDTEKTAKLVEELLDESSE